jgi:hypothetical protein
VDRILAYLSNIGEAPGALYSLNGTPAREEKTVTNKMKSRFRCPSRHNMTTLSFDAVLPSTISQIERPNPPSSNSRNDLYIVVAPVCLVDWVYIVSCRQLVHESSLGSTSTPCRSESTPLYCSQHIRFGVESRFKPKRLSWRYLGRASTTAAFRFYYTGLECDWRPVVVVELCRRWFS